MATRALDMLHNLVWIMLCCESERCRLICDTTGLADILPLWGPRGRDGSSLRIFDARRKYSVSTPLFIKSSEASYQWKRIGFLLELAETE